MQRPDFEEITKRLRDHSQNLKDNNQLGNSKLILAFVDLITVMGWSSSQQDTNNIQTANLIDEVKKLNVITSESNEQNQKLETSNYRLQWVMLALTCITTLVAIFPVFKLFFQWITPIITTALKQPALSASLISVLSAIFSILAVTISLVIFRTKLLKKPKITP